MSAAVTVLIVFSALALAALAASYSLYRKIFYSPHRGQNDLHRLPAGEQFEVQAERMLSMIERFAALPYEEVSVMSRDGLCLRGKYYHLRDGGPVALCFHGYRGMGIRDFSGAAFLCRDLGQNLLLVEERAQEGSQGHVISFGVNERFDCLCWVDYVRSRFGEDTPVLLYGVSMGAASVLMASGLELPKNVRGVVADCPFSSPADIIRKVCTQAGYPTALLWPLIRLGARVFGGFSLTGCDSVQAVKRASVPIMLMHGEDDRFVPVEMSRRIRDARPDLVTLHTFPNAGHGLSFMSDEPRYRALVTAFIASLGL